MKAIHCRVIPVAGYVIYICNLGKGGLNELDMTVKSALPREGFHERHLSDETKTRVACYMVAATNKRIREAWRYGSQKEQISLKRKQ